MLADTLTVTAGLVLLLVFCGAWIYLLVKGKDHGYQIEDQTRQTLDRHQAEESPEADGYR